MKYILHGAFNPDAAKALMRDHGFGTGAMLYLIAWQNKLQLEASPAEGISPLSGMDKSGKQMQRLYTILQSYEMSFRVDYRYQESQLLFSLWKGLNRTQEQQENGMAIFSDSFENILETSYSRNTADYKNFAYVAGAGEGNKRILEEVDQVLPGELRRELYVDARDLRPEREDGTVIPEEEYRRILRRRGLEKLAEFRAVEAIDGKADTHANLIYRTDFDLGDLCDYANPGIGLSVRKRMTEVREIYEGGTMRLDTVFGEDYVTNIKRIVQREVN